MTLIYHNKKKLIIAISLYKSPKYLHYCCNIKQIKKMQNLNVCKLIIFQITITGKTLLLIEFV